MTGIAYFYVSNEMCVFFNVLGEFRYVILSQNDDYKDMVIRNATIQSDDVAFSLDV